MAEEPATPAPGTDGTPQAGAGTDGGKQPQAGNEPSPGGDGGDTDSELKRARSDAAKYRHQLKAASDELEKLKTGQLSDQEKVVKERDDAKERVAALERQMRGVRVESAAAKLGFHDPADAGALIDWDTLDGDDPKAVERAVKQLLQAKPHLAPARNNADAGARGRVPANADMNQMIRQAAGRQ